MQNSHKTIALELFLILIIPLFATQFAAVNAQPKTVTVPNDYSTIQDAVDHANAGDTVFVKAGNYTLTGYPSGLTINKPISLIGQGKEDTILTQHLYKGSDTVIHVSADEVTISGFTIRGGMIDIEISGSNCKMTDNNIANGYMNGLEISGTNNIVSENDFTNNAVFGIYVTASDSSISNNSLSGNGYAGIILDSCKNVTISQNKILGNGNQEYENSTGGLILRWSGPFHVNGNIVSNNYGFGIQFGEGCNNAIVSNNNVIGNQFGFRLLNYIINPSGIASLGSGNQVFWNNVENNNVSVFIEHSSNFIINKEEGDIGSGTDIVSWDNGVVGNYWSDYSGYWSYVIDQNNADNHPFTQPIDITKPAQTPANSARGNSLTSLLFAVTAIVALAIIVVTILLYKRHRKTT